MKGIELFWKRKVPFLNAEIVSSALLKNTVCVATVLYILVGGTCSYNTLYIADITSSCDFTLFNYKVNILVIVLF